MSNACDFTTAQLDFHASSSSNVLYSTPPLQKVPSIIEIKRAIPKECFESSVVLSMYYVVRAGTIAIMLIFTLNYLRGLSFIYHTWIYNAIVSCGYIAIQGINFWGIFTLAHDCGHGAFSRYAMLNDTIGLLLHSIVLTPYEPWKVSHRLHHKNTGHLDRDVVYFPQRATNDHPLSRNMISGLGFAWFAYLINGFPPRRFNHFNPMEPLLACHRVKVFVSLAVQAWFVVTILVLTTVIGWRVMILYYHGPILVFASMLVITTFLNHMDDDIPWYDDTQWSYVRGNLSSVDRTYGALVDNMTHHIGLHQIHHLLPMIPHYKLALATQHFRQTFPQLARQSHEPIPRAFFRLLRMYAARGVVDDVASSFYLNRRFIGQNNCTKCRRISLVGKKRVS